MKETEATRVVDSDRQLTLCFDAAEPKDQSCASLSHAFRSVTVLPFHRKAEPVSPPNDRSSIEAVLLSRILQRTRLFR